MYLEENIMFAPRSDGRVTLFHLIGVLINNLNWLTICVCLVCVCIYLMWLQTSLMIHLSLFNLIVEELDRNRSRVDRPARTVRGSYGLITIPDSRDEVDCEKFMERQTQLGHLAREEGDWDRMYYHLANAIFVNRDPMCPLLAFFQRIPLAEFRRLGVHIRTISFQYYGCEDID